MSERDACASSSARGSVPRVAFVTLGCAKNEVDSDAMQRRARAAGYAIEEDPACADAVVVNTCAFLEAAVEESLGVIFDLAETTRADGSALPIVVAGCMPARYGNELESELVEAAAFVPCKREDDIAEVLASVVGSASETLAVEPSADERCPVSAYVKISDGCDRFCSYCAIPYIRGRYGSFTLESIDAEVSRLVAGGTREIVLIAQDTGRWGSDLVPPSNLAHLLDTLASRYPETWFRVMYLQPEGITDEVLDTMVAHDNIASYLDIPLQHVNARVLRAMNRTGSREEFDALLAHIRGRVPGITLRTTLIAGFPGETDEEFEELCDFLADAEFDYAGVFAYSREEGTRAAQLPDQIDEDTKTERAQQLRDIADAVGTRRVAERVGSTIDVLVLGCEEDGQLFGRAKCQAPDVDGVVYLARGEVGEIRTVTVVDTLLYEMEAE